LSPGTRSSDESNVITNQPPLNAHGRGCGNLVVAVARFS
jgi:hypothetical protein